MAAAVRSRFHQRSLCRATLFLSQLVMLQSAPEAWVWFVDRPGATIVTYLVLLFALLLVERLSTSRAAPMGKAASSRSNFSL